jgi:aspartyl-tRNA(Asn)/glutamyl-tRNA(Gln) amidotransferase subunit C
MAGISRDEVLHVARLARLELAPEDVQPMADELSSILDHIESMASLDLDGVEPTSHVVPVDAPLREDVAEPPLDREVALSQAPKRTETGFLVPSPQA